MCVSRLAENGQPPCGLVVLREADHESGEVWAHEERFCVACWSDDVSEVLVSARASTDGLMCAL